MNNLLAALLSATPSPSDAGTYSQDLAAAVAAAAGPIAMLVVIYLVIRATYLVLRVFSQFAFLITAAIIGSFMVIGLLNR